MYQSKIFANGLTTLPKPVREALGVKAGDRVRYVMSEKGVQVLRMPSDDKSLKVHADDPALLEALDAAEMWCVGNQTMPERYAPRRWGVMETLNRDFTDHKKRANLRLQWLRFQSKK